MIKKIIFFLIILSTFANSTAIDEIKIIGNKRVSDETILMLSNIDSSIDFNENNLNDILKELYQSGFFKDVKVSFEKNILLISVIENPIVENYFIEGVKNKSLLKTIEDNILFKSKSPFDENLIRTDKNNLLFILRKSGYYFSEVEIYTTESEDGIIDLTYQITLGEKAKIKKITFLGNKIFKDRKLQNLIVSEAYKPWKILSGRKFLNENIISLDQRLLTNYYKNKGYYNAVISTTFAKLSEKNNFELIYNIEAGKKFFFNDLRLTMPSDYDENNFIKINKLFRKLKGTPYSINIIEKILDEIETININEEFGSIRANVSEKIVSDKINLDFSIEQLDTTYLSRINIFGNNITEETVIRNQLIIDEGDPYNEILLSKSINNVKALNIFRSVKEQILVDENGNNVLNIQIEEKPTGEIAAGAGYGTSGGTISFSVKENNFLGKAVVFSNEISITEKSVKGGISVLNPNFKNSDNSLLLSFQASENDFMSTNGYKSSLTSLIVGTDFEYLDDLFLGVKTKNTIENLEVGSNASANQKKQAGDYFDSFLNFDLNYDKRNQKYETSDGFYSNFSTDIPVVSESLTFTNKYQYKIFSELYENNLTTLSVNMSTSNSLNNKNIRLSERLFIPSRNLRGFESGKVGPKDGTDFIGGNFSGAINFSSNLPKLTENFENIDLGLFIDAANLWGVDYDSSLESNNGIRSSIGLGVDWSTPIGPLSFSFATPITKENTDVTEFFRFNIGTTF